MSDPTERVAILRTDLEQWLQIFRWTHGYFMSSDLADNYREGRPDKQYSRITRLTASAHDRLEDYLNDESLQPD